MNKLLFAAIAVASIIISLIATPAFAASSGYLIIKSSSVTDTSGVQTVQITTKTAIPTNGKASAFGYGVFATNGVLAVTTHGGVGPDSETQTGTGDPVLHTHLVVPEATTDCASGLAVLSASFEEVGDLTIRGNKITIANVDSSVGTISPGAASFTLSVENGRVCINDLTVFP